MSVTTGLNTPLLFFLLLGTLGTPMPAQIDEQGLHQFLRAGTDGTLKVSKETEIKVRFGPKKQTCLVIVSGEPSPDSVRALFDQVAPPALRGTFGPDTGQLEQGGLGGSLKNATYEHVSLQIAEPSFAYRVQPVAVVRVLVPGCEFSRKPSTDVTFRFQPR